jgi:hypothetical protein
MSAVIIYTPPPQVRQAVNEALSLLPNAMDSADARVMLYAIGLHESRFKHRRQIIKKNGQLVPEGPAKGFWQFERGGGCKGVLTHPASRHHAAALCTRYGVNATARDLWDALEHNDVLAAGIARLLLWTDPKPLPQRFEPRAEAQGWCYYERVWRPGKPHPETWDDCWRAAVKAVEE